METLALIYDGCPCNNNTKRSFGSRESRNSLAGGVERVPYVEEGPRIASEAIKLLKLQIVGTEEWISF